MPDPTTFPAAPPSFSGLPIAYVRGEFVSSSEAYLHASDLSILRGYGVFDYLCYRNDGSPVFLNDYIDRFFGSAAGLDMEMPVEGSSVDEKKAFLANLIRELIHRNTEAIDGDKNNNNNNNGGVRMILTGGYSADGYTPQLPNLLLLAYPMSSGSIKSSARVLLHSYERQLPRAKTLDYVEGIRVQKKLRESQADFALYVDRDGNVRESDRSNYFIVDKDGLLITPSDNILLGITRKHLLLLAQKLGIETLESPSVTVEQVQGASEAIICSTTKGPVPISTIDGTLVGSGEVPGPITKRLMDAWWDYCKEN